MVRILCSDIKNRVIRPVCVKCDKNFGRKSNNPRSVSYNLECHSCQEKRLTGKPTTSRWRRDAKYVYLTSKKGRCEACGFLPDHECQLDVDHIDGNHKNHDPSNLQTLCSNCHRLKTQIHKEWESRKRAA